MCFQGRVIIKLALHCPYQDPGIHLMALAFLAEGDAANYTFISKHAECPVVNSKAVPANACRVQPLPRGLVASHDLGVGVQVVDI